MLRVVEMPALGLDSAARFSRRFLLPLGGDVIVGSNVEQTLQQERKCARRGFLEGKNLDVVIAYAEKVAVALEVRFREKVIEKGVAKEFRSIDLQGIEVQGSLEDDEGFFLCESANRHQVAHLGSEAFNLLLQYGLRSVDLPLI